MNIENLQKIYNHIQTIPEELLDMETYRNHNYVYYDIDNHNCNSVGCILGHSIILDEWKNIPNKYGKYINFQEWSKKFLDISDNMTWRFLFYGSWAYNSITNSKEQILKRIQYVIDHQTYHPNFYMGYYNFNLILD